MAKRALTNLGVKRIKPPRIGQADHFDAGYRGFALRVSYGGGKSWVFFYRHGGRHRRMTLGRYPAMELAEARSEWRRAREAAAKGRDPVAERQAQNAAPAVKLDLFERIADDCERRGFPSRQKRRELALRTKRGVPPPTRPAEGQWGTRLLADIS